MQYVGGAGSDEGCIFCDHLAQGDEVLHRGATAFVLLNAFPYNTGHLMIAPQRHVGEIGDLSPDERHELMDLAAESVRIVREAMSAHGFNLGMNLGDVAGAGIPGHLHVHVVPRWGGDTNFMTTVGETKVLPEMLADTAAKLKPLYDRLG
jgi:ATP adenylyltransferase